MRILALKNTIFQNFALDMLGILHLAPPPENLFFSYHVIIWNSAPEPSPWTNLAHGPILEPHSQWGTQGRAKGAMAKFCSIYTEFNTQVNENPPLC